MEKRGELWPSLGLRVVKTECSRSSSPRVSTMKSMRRGLRSRRAVATHQWLRCRRGWRHFVWRRQALPSSQSVSRPFSWVEVVAVCSALQRERTRGWLGGQASSQEGMHVIRLTGKVEEDRRHLGQQKERTGTCFQGNQPTNQPTL